MTEETKEVVKEEVVFSEVEQRAQEDGWMPKEAWVEAGKSETDWRPAREFLDRGELFKTIHTLKRENKQTQQTLDALQRHHQFVFEQAHKKALDDLRKERRQALKDEDVERVEAIEEKIEKVEQEHQEVKVKMQTPQPSQVIVPEFQEWKSRNSWYDSDEELREYADVEGLVYLQKHPEMRNSPAAALKAIEERVKKRFPEKFGVRKAAPSAVTAVDKTAKKTSKSDSDIELDETEKEIMKTFIKQGIMTEAQYKEELKKAKAR